MSEVNWIAVALCAVSSLVLGGFWYSPVLFARQWQTAAGLLSLLAAAVFAMFLGNTMSVGAAAAAGFSARLCWVAASYGISYGFERRPLKLWLTLFGLILGLMS